MFSKISTWLDQSDNEFVKDFSTHESRQTKLRQLQSTRLTFIATTFVAGVMAFSIYFLQLLLTTVFARYAGGSSLLLLFFPLMTYVLLMNFIHFFRTDAQIKMLLLFEQTQPKG